MLVAGDVQADVLAPALQVAHLAEDAAVGGEHALDGLDRAVGVHVDVHGGPACQIHILGGHLAVGDELVDHRLGAHKAALAVGDGHGVQVAHVGPEHPGGLDAGHPGGDIAALVAADEVIGQGGASCHYTQLSYQEKANIPKL